MYGLIGSSMAKMGRGGDTMMAHLTPGEVVIPKEVAALRPDLVAHVGNQIRSMGGNPSTIVAGRGRINPSTGMEEFATEAEVTAAYQANLGRAPEAEGLAYWMGQNDLSGFKAAAAPEIVQNTYQSTFGRPAEQAGIDYWTGQGATNANYDYGSAIKAGAQNQDIIARNDIAAGGVDTSTTWGNGASLTNPNLKYDAENNTWGTLKKPLKPVERAVNSAGQQVVSTAAPVATTPSVNLEVKPNQTMKQQVWDIAAQDSPLMQQARGMAMQQMNERGLINSSIGVGAAQDATYRAAMPIAQADAATYFDAGKTSNAYENQFLAANNNQSRELQKMATAHGYDLDNMTEQQKNSMELLMAQAKNARDLSTLNNDSTAALQASAGKEARKTGMQAAATNLTNQMNMMLARVDNDASLTTPEAINAAKLSIRESTAAAIRVLGHASDDADISAMIDVIFPPEGI